LAGWHPMRFTARTNILLMNGPL
jgi:hypothetical protein